MPALAAQIPWLQARLDELVAVYDLPAVAVAIVDHSRDEVVEASSGVVDVQSGVAATPDTLFALWSIAKVYTTTLVMQLVDEGLLDLDAPVSLYLPEFRPDDPPERAIMVRQLLSHTSGLRGDIYADFGRGDDCIDRCVASLVADPIPPPGTHFSYSNAGFAVAGLLVQRLTRQSWDAALHTMLLEPLGLKQTLTLRDGEELSRRQVAAQHRPDPATGKQVPGDMWPMQLGWGPAGTSLHVSAGDLVAFARLHLRDGKAPDGTTVLSPQSVRAMQAQEVKLPVPTMQPKELGPPTPMETGIAIGTGYGLGWERLAVGGCLVLGHGGGTSNILRLLPEQGLAFGAVSNGVTGRRVAEEVFAEFVTDVVGIRSSAPATPEPTAGLDPNLDGYAGHYVGIDMSIDVVATADRVLTARPASNPWAPAAEYQFRMIDRSQFDSGSAGRGAFLDFEGDSPRYLYLAKHTLARQ